MQKKLKIEGELIVQSNEGHAFVVKTDDYNIVVSFKNWDSLIYLLRTKKIRFRKSLKQLSYGRNLLQRVVIVVSGKILLEIANGKISKIKLKEFFKLYYHYLRSRIRKG